ALACCDRSEGSVSLRARDHRGAPACMIVQSGEATAVFFPCVIAAAVAVTHLDSRPAFVVIAPGYRVQARLFETHRALGGFGYQVTMVGVSALVWTLIIFSLASAVRLLRRLVR